jgi:hypothetical protein
LKYIIYAIFIACIVGYLVSFALAEDNASKESVKQTPVDIIKMVVSVLVALIVVVLIAVKLYLFFIN